MRQNVGLDDDAVVVNSDSDEDVDMDDDTVLVAAAARVQPSDAGFSDFADFGGFQPSDDAPISFGRGKHGAAAASGGAAGDAEAEAEDETSQNGFADPTDAGPTPAKSPPWSAPECCQSAECYSPTQPLACSALLCIDFSTGVPLIQHLMEHLSVC